MSRIKIMGAALVLATLAVVGLSAPATAFDCQGSCWSCTVPNGGRCAWVHTLGDGS